MKRLAWLTAVALATIAVLWVLWQFRDAAVLFLLSLAVAATIRPFVTRQLERGVPRGAALLLIYLFGLSLTFILILGVGETVLAELQEGADTFVLTYDRVWAEWPQGDAFQQTVIRWLPPPTNLYEMIASGQGEAVARSVLGVTLSVFDNLSQLAIVLVLSLYWGLDQTRFERLWLSLLPVEGRARARDIWQAIESGAGAYIRSEGLQSLVAGLLLGLGYWMIGLKYPTLLAIASALAWLIPWLGAVLALGPVLLVGLSASMSQGLLAAVYTLVIFLVMEFVLEPRLFNRQRFSSLLVVVMVIVLGDAWGLAGVLAAPPVAAALQILFSRLVQQNAPSPATQLAEQFEDLNERLAAVRAMLADPNEPPSPQAGSMVERLGRLIEQAYATTEKASPSLPPRHQTVHQKPG